MRKVYYSLATEERVARVTIFGDITSVPLLESDVSSFSLHDEIDNLDVDKIEVHINSYGGEVAEALAITNSLLRHPAKVDTFVDGFACSAATIIFMAGDRRVMSPFSAFLVHPAWAHIDGNAEDLRKEANSLDAVTEQSINAYMQRITKSRDELVNLMAEERFLTPEETLAWGFATEIDPELMADRPTQNAMVLVKERLTQEPKVYDPVALIDQAIERFVEHNKTSVQTNVQTEINVDYQRIETMISCGANGILHEMRKIIEMMTPAPEPEPKESAKPNLMNNFIKAFERKDD